MRTTLRGLSLRFFAFIVVSLIFGSNFGVGRARAQTVAFPFFGDFGTGDRQQREVAEALKKFCDLQRCDFLLTLGDNVYPNGVRSVDDPDLRAKIEVPYGPIGRPMYGILGNHDHRGNVQAQIDFSARSSVWRLPARDYAFIAGPAQFLGLDSNNPITPEQKTWFATTADSAPTRWKLAFAHHPIISYGHHDEGLPNAEAMRGMMQNKIDVFFAGHEHDKQVILGTQNDPIFAISGAAAKVRPTRSGPGTRFAASTLGFGYFSITGAEALLQYIDVEGKVEYSATIRKSDGGVRRFED